MVFQTFHYISTHLIFCQVIRSTNVPVGNGGKGYSDQDKAEVKQCFRSEREQDWNFDCDLVSRSERVQDRKSGNEGEQDGNLDSDFESENEEQDWNFDSDLVSGNEEQDGNFDSDSESEKEWNFGSDCESESEGEHDRNFGSVGYGQWLYSDIRKCMRSEYFFLVLVFISFLFDTVINTDLEIP